MGHQTAAIRGRLAMRAACAFALAGASSCGTDLAWQRRAQGGGQPAQLPNLSAAPTCDSQTVAAATNCVQRWRLERDVGVVAKPRPSGSPHHSRVRAHCQQTLAALGYEIIVHPYGSGTNVVGRKLGFSKPKQVVVVGAHYDQRASCSGADDNASGVAATLEVARVLARGRFDHSLEVACWDEGERGMLGSAAHARSIDDERSVRLALAFDSVAFTSQATDSQRIPASFERLWPEQALALQDDANRGRFLTVFADYPAAPFADRLALHSRDKVTTHVLLVSEAVKKKNGGQRADHASFWATRSPAILLTDSGAYRNPHAACKTGDDSPESLDYQFLTFATEAAVAALVTALEPR